MNDTVEKQVSEAINASGLDTSKHCLPAGSPDAVVFDSGPVEGRPNAVCMTASNILTTQGRKLGLMITIDAIEGKPSLEFVPFSGPVEAKVLDDLSSEEKEVLSGIKTDLLQALPLDPLTRLMVLLLDVQQYPPNNTPMNCDNPRCSCHGKVNPAPSLALEGLN